jgi:adenosine kinase
VSNKQHDILISGYVSMDHVLKIDSPAKVGYSSIISNKSNTKIYYGGCPVNISYALCRVGVSAMPVIRVGEDYESIGFRDFLEKGGVPTGAVSRVPGEITSVCYLIEDNDGQHITLFYPGAMDGSYAKPMDDRFFTAADIGLLTVGPYEDNVEFFAKIKKHRLPLVFGMKSDYHAFPADFLREVLQYSSILFTNEEERASIEKMFDMEMPDLLQKGNAHILITTLGKKGSRYYCKTPAGTETGDIPICDKGPPVDTSGSGDAYIAGFLYGYRRGRSVRECALLGSVLSSFIIEQEGCCSSAPDERALLERYEWFITQLKGEK